MPASLRSFPELAVVTEPRSYSQGAEVTASGVRYRTWSEHDLVEAAVLDQSERVLRTLALESEGDGYFSGYDGEGKPGDLYKYRLRGVDLWPDPASRFQPSGVHGPSMVIASEYPWRDDAWVHPALPELVIYEIHVGAFTREGTFRAAAERLSHLAALGVTAVELMPLGDFPGERNWGYDGVMLYAPARAYGRPDDLRAFVEAAHRHGLAVILDVVYNHFGPDGNYTGLFHSGYFHPDHETPWGKALNYSREPVRKLFLENTRYWMDEFHIDGFRLDATHSIIDDSPTHILAEIAETIQARGGFVIAEDERNEPAVLNRRENGGLGFDGVWADDFHHVVRVRLTGEREGYYANFEGTSSELVQTLTHGWLFRGQTQPATDTARGGRATGLPPHKFVYCISNHDQVGNRAFGDRLGEIISSAAYRAASALLCLVPQTPLLFMGQEWRATTPFQFFTDHKGDLGALITNGRRREFQNFSAFREPAVRETIPDPQAAETFLSSKLNWDELEDPEHAKTLLLYSEFLRLRRTTLVVWERGPDSCFALELTGGVIALLYGCAGECQLAVVCDLAGGNPAPNMDYPRLAPGGGRDWHPVLSSNERRFGGNGCADFSVAMTIAFLAR